MFVVDAAVTIKWPVTVSLPVDGGEIADYCFTGIFKRLSDEEMDKLLDKPKTISDTQAEDTRIQDVLRENADIFPKLMIGWEGVKTAAGEDSPFSIEILKSLITGPNGKFTSVGIWSAIREIRNGAIRGN